MKVPLSWLKEYLSLTQTPEQLAEVLTLAGIEVDGITPTPESDILFEISLTPNLGHCMSILGLARELSAHLNLPLNTKEFPLEEVDQPVEKLIQIQLIDKKQCSRYACRIVRGIQVRPSPEWLKRKVESCGVRSINNIVDVGNLVMLELGQPLHMFDYDRIENKKIIITSQTAYLELETLDGVKRPIPPEALLICDGSRPLAFAGIMGGKDSSVTEQTSTILIEAACFSPQSIRKTSKWLGIKSDSSQRFEKGVDPNGPIVALKYAAHLLGQVAGGKTATGFIDQKSHEFHEKKVLCRTERANRLLGTELSTGEIATLLGRLCIRPVDDRQLYHVPTWRNDIAIEVDLIEEVARVFGYNNIPKCAPRHISSTLFDAPAYTLEKRVRERLVAEGLQELMTCDLISPEQAKRVQENASDPDAVISVLHSHSVDQSVLRTSLLPGLLQAVKYNSDHGSPNCACFEVGRVHFKEKDQFVEPSTAGIILCGKRKPWHWDPKPGDFDFFDLKGLCENLLASLNITGVTFEISHLHNFHPGRQARIKKENAILGVLGEVHPQQIAELDIPQRLFFAEISLGELLPFLPKHKAIAPISLFPGSERDWTVTLNDNQPVEQVLRAVQSAPSHLLEKVILLDLYKSDQIGKDRKNATFRFFYRDTEKTISLETVEKEHARITAAAASTLK